MSSLALLLATEKPVPAESDEAWLQAFGRWNRGKLNAWLDAGQVGEAKSTFADFAAETGTPSRISLADLGTGSARPVRIANGQAWVANRAALDSFESTPQDVEKLREVVRAYGGEGILAWTNQHLLNVVVARGATVAHASVRLRSPADVGRPAAERAALVAALEGTRLVADRHALDAQLASPSISVTAFFAALGVEGADELVRADAPALWTDFERVADALLAGRAGDKQALERLNAVLGDVNREARFAAKPLKNASKMRDQVMLAARALEQVAGPATRELGQPDEPSADRAAIERHLATLPPGRRVTRPEFPRDEFPGNIAVEDDRVMTRISVASSDDAYLAELHADLRAGSVFHGDDETWRRGGEIYGVSEYVYVGKLVWVLGWLPPGSSVAFALGRQPPHVWRFA